MAQTWVVDPQGEDHCRRLRNQVEDHCRFLRNLQVDHKVVEVVVHHLNHPVQVVEAVRIHCANGQSHHCREVYRVHPS